MAQGHLHLVVKTEVLISFFLILLFNETFKLTLFGNRFGDGNTKVLSCSIIPITTCVSLVFERRGSALEPGR